jgi:hypothetical protein
MKKKLLLITIIIFLSGCNSNPDSYLKYFIIGRWKGEFQQEINKRNVLVKYELFFLPNNILLKNITRQNEIIRDYQSTYKFRKNNYVIIEGRNINEIEIARENQDLIIIYSKFGLPPEGRYSRVYFAWEDLVIYLLFTFTIFIQCIYKRRKKRVDTDFNNAVKEPD